MPEDKPVWSFEDLGILLGMVLPSLVVAALVGKGLALWIPQKGVVAVVVQVLIYAGVLGSLYMLLKVRYGVDFWRAMAWRAPWRGMALTAVLGPILAVALPLLGILLGMREEALAINALLKDRPSVIAIAIAATTIGPVFEELLFRGFLQPLMVRSLGVAAGLVLTALPFALAHGPQYNWGWQRLLVLGLASICFGAVRLATGSTAASALTHAAYNLTHVGALLFKETN